jgi:hypothetical protein
MRGIQHWSLGAISLLFLLLISANAGAVAINLNTADWQTNSGNAPSTATVNDNATWDWNNGTKVLTGSGTFERLWDISPAPNNELFTHKIVDLVIDVTNLTVTATSYDCIEGPFGASVGASLCGNYGFGDNLFDNSTLTYTPNSTAYTFVLGGDDVSFSPLCPSCEPQRIQDYAPVSHTWDGTNLTITSQVILGGAAALAFPSALSDGYTMTFSVPAAAVPVPAAAWLFASALGALGWCRRKVY